MKARQFATIALTVVLIVTSSFAGTNDFYRMRFPLNGLIQIYDSVSSNPIVERVWFQTRYLANVALGRPMTNAWPDNVRLALQVNCETNLLHVVVFDYQAQNILATIADIEVKDLVYNSSGAFATMELNFGNFSSPEFGVTGGKLFLTASMPLGEDGCPKNFFASGTGKLYATLGGTNATILIHDTFFVATNRLSAPTVNSGPPASGGMPPLGGEIQLGSGTFHVLSNSFVQGTNVTVVLNGGTLSSSGLIVPSGSMLIISNGSAATFQAGTLTFGTLTNAGVIILTNTNSIVPPPPTPGP